MPQHPPETSRARVPDALDQPLVVNGWSLYVWPTMAERWNALREDAERVYREVGPAAYAKTPQAKMLAMVAALMFHEIPMDPGHPQYRQGNTLGPSYRHWRRAKFFQRFRLFFRYHSERKILVYVWLNDETTLRKRGARTDVYTVFEDMLRDGRPPNDFEALLRECARVGERDATSPT